MQLKPIIVKKKEEVKQAKKLEPIVEPKPTSKVEESEWEEDEEEEAAIKERERMRRLRNMNRRAHRGFTQAEIMMMRFAPSPKVYPTGEDEYDWECHLCKRLISGVLGTQPQKYLELKCKHRYHMQCLEVWFMRENICSVCEHEVLLPDVI